MKKHTLKIDDTEITYYKKGEGKPLILFHGGAIRARTYKEIINLLAKNFTVYAPDLPGHAGTNLSTSIKDYDDIGSLFSKFIDKLGFETVDLIGHSFGGGTALAIAKFSKKVNKLVLVATAGIPLNYSAMRLLWGFTFKSYNGSFRYGMWRHYFFANNEQYAALLPRIFELFKVLSFLIRNTLIGVKDIENISNESLLIWGDHDEIFDLNYAKRLDSKLTNSKLEVYTGNHDLFFYKKEYITDRIIEFLI